MELATQRRLQDELNVHAELEFVYKFSYQADFGGLGSENELCHIYLGKNDGDVQANDHEVDSIRFLSVADLEAEFESTREQFTPWFLLEWQALRTSYQEKLLRYLGTQPT